MLEKLIQDLRDDCTKIKIYLNASLSIEAEQTLVSAAKKLQELMEYADFSFFIPNYEKSLSESIDIFVEVFMKVSFASAYHEIAAYEKTLSANDTDQATVILQKLESKMTFMEQSYSDAQRDGQSQTAAFIDFEKDFSYLRKTLENAKKEAVIEQMCTNFAKAMDFKGTMYQFFYWSRNMTTTTTQTPTPYESMTL